MPTYKVKFEFFGRHMVHEVDAANEQAAREAVIKRLNFHATERQPLKRSDLIDENEFDELLKKLGVK